MRTDSFRQRERKRLRASYWIIFICLCLIVTGGIYIHHLRNQNKLLSASLHQAIQARIDMSVVDTLAIDTTVSDTLVIDTFVADVAPIAPVPLPPQAAAVRQETEKSPATPEIIVSTPLKQEAGKAEQRTSPQVARIYTPYLPTIKHSSDNKLAICPVQINIPHVDRNDVVQLQQLIDNIFAYRTDAGLHLIREVHRIAKVHHSRKPSTSTDKLPYTRMSEGVNPGEIRSVAILKGLGNNSAIFGEHGKNGVILMAHPEFEVFEPAPIIGYKAYQKYIDDHRHIPAQLFMPCTNTRGAVKLEFDIDNKGRPTNINVLESVCHAYNDEAIRLITNGALWSICYVFENNRWERVKATYAVHFPGSAR